MASSHNLLLTQAQRIATAEVLPEFDDRLKLNEKNPRKIPFTVEELKSIQKSLQAARSHADTGMKRTSLRHVVDAITKVLEVAEGIGSIPSTDRLYQFKITLLRTNPSIWRRIQVRNCTLDKLHERIQTAMGWRNCHLHQFKINGERHGDPELIDRGHEENFQCVDSTQTQISDLVLKTGERFQFDYEYDFGDSWHHEILFEGCLQSVKGVPYPICIEGERACPPEDVGGIGGYYRFLKAIADPKHKQHEELLEWIGGKFDPEKFDVEKATRKMRRGLPDWRLM